MQIVTRIKTSSMSLWNIKYIQTSTIFNLYVLKSIKWSSDIFRWNQNVYTYNLTIYSCFYHAHKPSHGKTWFGGNYGGHLGFWDTWDHILLSNMSRWTRDMFLPLFRHFIQHSIITLDMIKFCFTAIWRPSWILRP